MTFVYNEKATEIKREPTAEEVAIVEEQEKIVNNLYESYTENHSKMTKENFTIAWNEYLKENDKLKSLWNKYMGYCY